MIPVWLCLLSWSCSLPSKNKWFYYAHLFHPHVCHIELIYEYWLFRHMKFTHSLVLMSVELTILIIFLNSKLWFFSKGFDCVCLSWHWVFEGHVNKCFLCYLCYDLANVSPGFAQTFGVVKAARLSLAPWHVGSDLGLSLGFPWKNSLVFTG